MTAAAALNLDAEEGEELLDHDAPTPPPVDIESDQVLTQFNVLDVLLLVYRRIGQDCLMLSKAVKKEPE